MADEIKEFSKEEVSGLVFHGAPQPAAVQQVPVQQAPIQQAPVQQVAPSAPIAPPMAKAPKAKDSPLPTTPEGMADLVAKQNRKLKEEAPTPEPPSAISGLVDQITTNWKPLAIGAGGAAALYGAAKAAPYVKQGAEKLYEGGKRLMSRTPAADTVRIEPTFASDHEMRQAEILAQRPAPVANPLENLQQRAADLTASVQGKATPGPVAPVAGMGSQPVAPTLPGAISNAPAGIPSVQNPFTAAPQPSVETAVATGGNVNKAVQQTVAQEIDKPVAPVVNTPKTPAGGPEVLRTGTGREVIAGQGPVPQRFAKEYKSPTDVPKGFAFLPGGQYIDVLRNDLGQPTYTQQFTSKDFPGTYPESVEAAKTINRELNRPTREQMKAQGIAPPEVTEGIVRKVGPSKIVKVGGVAGALVSIADLAKAENAQQRREAAGNFLLGFLPPGLDVGGLNADEDARLKQMRALQAYAQLVGGGRGLTPASAYPQGGMDYNSPKIKR